MLLLLKYDFIRQALLAIVAMSLFAPLIGTFLILRKQSLLSDTLGHISLAGVALGVLLRYATTITTIIVVIISAIFLEYLRSIYKDFIELGTAILMSFGLAVAMVVMSKTSSSTVSLENYLFGSVITIGRDQVISLFVIGLIIIGLYLIFKRQLYIMTFDEDIAYSEGLCVRLMSVFFNILTGVSISLMIPAVGALLVSTIVILPASISIRLGKNFKTVLLLGSLVCFVGMFLGVIASYYLETPASATITLIFIAMFLVINLICRLKK